MEWGDIITWITALGSLGTIVGVVLQIRSGISFGRENSFRSMLMFHRSVYERYKTIVDDVNGSFWEARLSLGIIMSSLLISLFIFILGGLPSTPHFLTRLTILSLLIALLLSFPGVIRSRRMRLILSNVIVPTFLLVSIPVVLSGHGAIWANIAVAFIVEITWVIIFTRMPLVVKGRWNDILTNGQLIEESLFGLIMMYTISAIIVVILWLDFGIAPLIILSSFLGLLILSYVIVDVKDTATKILWKRGVLRFADHLPYLIVKTKTGNIYYGQLYDPLDSKVLVLRKSKLMHSGEIIEGSSLVTKMSKEGDYWNILWKDIESIKIVENGLYAPPGKPDSNFSLQDTGKSSEKDEKDKGKKPESTTEKTENESKSKT